LDLWQINADESQDLLRELKVYGIRTLIVYRDGKETMRQVGAKPAGTLHNLFESLATGNIPAPAGLSNADRLIRLGVDIAATEIGWVSHMNWALILLGGVFTFSAGYDRCPIWRALTTQFKKMTGQA
jgi:thioredoxin 1